MLPTYGICYDDGDTERVLLAASNLEAAAEVEVEANGFMASNPTTAATAVGVSDDEAIVHVGLVPKQPGM
jgi:hypothetical protein